MPGAWSRCRTVLPGHHGSTFGGSPLACRIGCTVLDIMEREHIPRHAAAMGERLLSGLRDRLEKLPDVVAIRGHGLMVGIEMDAPCTELVGLALAQENLLISVTRGNTIRLLPPLVIDAVQIDDIVDRLGRLLELAAEEDSCLVPAD